LAVGGAFVDVVGVNVEGGVTLCECKLARNPGARREVVGQLLEYAATLRGLDYEAFSDRFQARATVSLLDAVSDIAGEGFDAEAFEAAVSDNLIAGRFRLVIAVDRITEALK